MGNVQAGPEERARDKVAQAQKVGALHLLSSKPAAAEPSWHSLQYEFRARQAREEAEAHARGVPYQKVGLSYLSGVCTQTLPLKPDCSVDTFRLVCLRQDRSELSKVR
jgi:hypothetical protein